MESLQGGGCRQLRESGGYIRETASLLTDMAVRDLSSSYRDAAGGYVWLFAKPAVTVLVYYIVFQVFFGMSETNSGAPYALWFLSGMLPWIFFAETLGGGTGCYQEYSCLVKKIRFPVRLIPIVKVFSGLCVHLFFLAFFSAVSVFCNHFMRISLVFLIYAVLCLCVYTGLLVSVFSLIRAFFRDVSDLIGLLLQAGIWMVPILWDFSRVPGPYRMVFAWNPLFHVIQGYRRGLGCGGEELFRLSGILFWLHCILLACCTELAYRKLIHHLADVL